jgi:hypothetical protein
VRGAVEPMNSNYRIHLVWIVAAVTALPGIYYLIRDPSGIFIHIEWLINGEIPSETMPLWVTIATILMYFVLILRPISAYGLFKLRVWGKGLAIGTLCLDLGIRVMGFVNTWTYYDHHPEARKIIEELEKEIASGQVQNVEYINMVPSYIVAATCLISILLLLKMDFNKLQAKEA